MQYRGAAGSFRMPPPQQRERKPLPLRKQRRGLFAAEKEKQWPQGDGCGETAHAFPQQTDSQHCRGWTKRLLRNACAFKQRRPRPAGGKHVQHRFIGDIHAATPGAAMAQSFYAKAASTVSREARARQSAAPTIAEALGKASASSGRRRPQRSRQHAVFAGICPRIYAGKARAEAAKHRAPPAWEPALASWAGALLHFSISKNRLRTQCPHCKSALSESLQPETCAVGPQTGSLSPSHRQEIRLRTQCPYCESALSESLQLEARAKQAAILRRRPGRKRGGRIKTPRTRKPSTATRRPSEYRLWPPVKTARPSVPLKYLKPARG